MEGLVYREEQYHRFTRRTHVVVFSSESNKATPEILLQRLPKKADHPRVVAPPRHFSHQGNYCHQHIIRDQGHYYQQPNMMNQIPQVKNPEAMMTCDEVAKAYGGWLLMKSFGSRN